MHKVYSKEPERDISSKPGLSLKLISPLTVDIAGGFFSLSFDWFWKFIGKTEIFAHYKNNKLQNTNYKVKVSFTWLL